MPDLYSQLRLPEPYDDQVKCIDQLRAGIGRGAKGQVLVAPPGFGKTVVAQHMIAGAVRKGTRGLFVVDRLSLLEQTSRRFHEAGIEHGIYGGGDMNRGWYEPIRVAMAQTIAKRGWPGADFIVVDECHFMYDYITQTLPEQGCPYIGLTATPFARGMGKLYPGGLVQSTTTNKLLAEGRLSPLRIKSAIEIDMTDATKVAGEWTARDVQSRGRRIIGDIVSTYVEETNRHFEGPVKTMVFAASIAHGDELCTAFQEVGLDFRQVSAYDDPEQRNRTMAAFRHGDFPGIVSCEVLSKGVDIPDLLCLVIARPYVKAFAAHIQMLGRAMRVAQGKEYALVLDHAGNCLGFYHETAALFENGVDKLDDGKFQKVKRAEKKPTDATCSGCDFVMPPGAKVCPVCGKERKRRSDLEIVPGQMIEIDAISKGKRGWKGTDDELWAACCSAAGRWLHQHGDVARAQRQAKAHFHELSGGWPADRFKFVPGGTVPKAIQRKIDQNYRAWKKAQAERKASNG